MPTQCYWHVKNLICWSWNALTKPKRDNSTMVTPKFKTDNTSLFRNNAIIIVQTSLLHPLSNKVVLKHVLLFTVNIEQSLLVKEKTAKLMVLWEILFPKTDCRLDFPFHDFVSIVYLNFMTLPFKFHDITFKFYDILHFNFMTLSQLYIIVSSYVSYN